MKPAKVVAAMNPLGVVQEWLSWCRLCAKDDLQGNIHLFVKQQLREEQSAVSCDVTGNHYSEVNLTEAIEKHFSITIRRDEPLPKVLCTECYTLVTSLVNFKERVLKVQDMFRDLLDSAESTQFDFHAMRLKYDLLDEGREQVLQNQSTPEVFCSSSMTEMEALEMESEPDQNNEWADKDNQNGDCSNDEEATDADEDYEPPKTKSRRKRKHCKDEQYGDNNEETSSKHPKQFKCSQCFWVFKTKARLDKHELEHLTSEMKKVVPCPQCQKKFKTNSLLQSHIMHAHLDERPFKCDKCSVAVKTRNLLKQHMLIHTDYAPFECEVCKKACKSQHRLKLHMISHDTVKLVCSECGMQLKNRLSFRRHMAVHKEKMEHTCDYCGRAFKRGDALKYHLLVHTGLKPYACNFCGRTYASGVNCRLHQQNKHSVELAKLEAEGKPIGSGSTYSLNFPSLEALKEVAKTAINLAPAPPRKSRIGKGPMT